MFTTMPQEIGSNIPWRRRLTVRLTAGVTLVLLLIGIPFLLAFHNLRRNQQIDALDESATRLSLVVADGLRSAMLSGQPHLFDQPIRNLSRQDNVERVILLDHGGRVRVSSDPEFDGRVFDRDRDSTCRACHMQTETPPRQRTVLIQDDGRRLFRAITTIANEERCHRCHDPALASNGLLLMDLNFAATDAPFFAGIGATVILGTVMVLLTIAVLVMLLRRMVHEPLRAVVTQSRRVVEGDLDARAAVNGPGEFAQLATHVNRMTDHLARSLRTVETQRRELQDILDAVDDEIVVLDEKQRVVAANQAFKAAFGDTEPDIRGRLCRDGVGARSTCAVDRHSGCPVDGVFRTGRLQKGISSRIGPDGRERAIEIHASPLRGEDGAVRHAVEVRRDISERRQMEAILAHSEHMASLGLLASGLSHEINNPLAAIGTGIEGLRRRLRRDDGLAPETARAYEDLLARIAREVERGRDITSRLLKVARPATGARTLVDLNRIVQDIVAILAHDIKKSAIDIDLDLADTLPLLREDESRLDQALMNLILNAIQSMNVPGGTLRIVTGVRDGGLEVGIEDTGCGIPPETLKRIYEPFFTTKPTGQGTGLGLFITHQIVSEMNGTMQVFSTLGKGTRFQVWIPTGGTGKNS